MFELAKNQLELLLDIYPVSPILVKSGRESAENPVLPSLSFVRTAHPDNSRLTIYIPGSSLKGAMRSHALTILKSLDSGSDDALWKAVSSVGDEDDKKKDEKQQKAYKNAAPLERLFGSTDLAGRLRLSDFYPPDAVDTLPIRQMVAIDRRSGASANTFTMETAPPRLPSGENLLFQGRLTLRNFERRQFALIALILRDLHAGRVTIGFGSSRGLGVVRLAYRQMKISYPSLLSEKTFLRQLSEVLPYYLLGLAEFDNPTMLQNISPEFNVDPIWEWGEGATLTIKENIEEVFRAVVASTWQNEYRKL